MIINEEEAINLKDLWGFVGEFGQGKQKGGYATII